MALKLHTVLSDGSTNPTPTITVMVRHPETGADLPGVVVTALAKQQGDWRRIRKQHEHLERNPHTRQVEPIVDTEAAIDGLLVEAIQAWRGIVGADDAPLAVCPAAVAALDPRVKTQLYNAVLGAEVTETAPASFREPPPLV